MRARRGDGSRFFRNMPSDLKHGNDSWKISDGHHEDCPETMLIVYSPERDHKYRNMDADEQPLPKNLHFFLPSNYFNACVDLTPINPGGIHPVSVAHKPSMSWAVDHDYQPNVHGFFIVDLGARRVADVVSFVVCLGVNGPPTEVKKRIERWRKKNKFIKKIQNIAVISRDARF